MFYGFDSSYLLLVFIPTLLLSAAAQLYLSSMYNKWSRVRNSANWTGAPASPGPAWKRASST